jgi:ribosomal protein L20A (L18A)
MLNTSERNVQQVLQSSQGVRYFSAAFGDLKEENIEEKVLQDIG